MDHTPCPETLCGAFSQRLGKLLLLAYNIVQLNLEIMLIMVVAFNCSFWWKEDYGQTFNCGNMIAHYLFFLSWVNQFTFFCIACIFAKLTKIESDWGDHEQHPPLVKFRHFIFPMISWIWLKSNHYHYLSITLNVLIQSILTLISPITYFCTIAMPGKFCLIIPYEDMESSKSFLILQAPWTKTSFVNGKEHC